VQPKLLIGKPSVPEKMGSSRRKLADLRTMLNDIFEPERGTQLQPQKYNNLILLINSITAIIVKVFFFIFLFGFLVSRSSDVHI
jgi:hypothetical protein